MTGDPLICSDVDGDAEMSEVGRKSNGVGLSAFEKLPMEVSTALTATDFRSFMTSTSWLPIMLC